MIAAIVLAAGSATRFGSCKQLAPIDGKPMLQHVLELLRTTRIDRTVVVLGAHATEIRAAVRFDRERIVLNPEHAEGLSTSIRAGLRDLDADAALIVLGDQPFVAAETIDRVIAEHARTRADIVIPTHQGRRGNPVLIDRALFAEVEALRGDVGFRALFAEHAGAIVTVETDDRGILRDVDAPHDLA